jgi:LPS-assembly protein
MNPIDRRQEFTLFVCCGLVAVFSGETAAQASSETSGFPPVSHSHSHSYSRAAVASTRTPLFVDPALLGLPPLPKTAISAVPPLPIPVEPVSAGPSARPSPVTPPRAPSGKEADESSGKSGFREAEPALRATSRIAPSRNGSEPRPVFLSALRMAGEAGREFVAEGEAELRKSGSAIDADMMTYWPLEDEVEAEGGVRLQQGDNVMTGPKLRLRLEDRIGYFEQPSYRLKHQSLLDGRGRPERKDAAPWGEPAANAPFRDSRAVVSQPMGFAPGFTRAESEIGMPMTTESRGEADRLYFEGENHYRLENTTFTTCSVDNDSWYVRASDLKLDYDEETGKGRNATLYFKDVPFLYSPWMGFSLNNRRKSGFLRPSIGTSSDNGLEFQLPYYWNIAPNRDAMITPRVMSKRGVQFSGEYRYLDTALGGVYHGQMTAEYLPGDRLRDGIRRHGISLMHEQTTGNGFSGTINFNKVSDDYYYTDLSSDITATSQAQLLQQGVLAYGGGWWNASINMQQYQTLQPDKNNPVLEQYRMLPQLTVNARKPDFHGVDFNFFGQYTRFSIEQRRQFGTVFPDGKRAVLYPRISLPYVKPGWYVTPGFGVNYRRYSLSGQDAGHPGSVSVALPVLTVDSGMTFERSERLFGNDYTQTLEPRLYYVYIPYRNQSHIPLFDTALADFNFAQIFSENQFSGQDRINNANQITAALTSRLIDPESGQEIMRAMFGQRFHFSQNRVALDGVIDDDGGKWGRSDFLAGFGGQILPKVYVDAAWQFDPYQRRTKRYSVEMRYQPEPGKVLNVAYRLHRETASPVNQVDVSGQWPIRGRWHGVGRLNYSFKDDGTVLSSGEQGGRIIESIAGLEYNGGCWVLRGVIRRQALTSAHASTSFFVQLELSGLGRIGTNPLSLLKRNIPGYGLIGGNGSEAVFD